ncbi:MAG: tetratricopeptide repeat protein [Bacteroidetes bacterium]|nr:tetratricopeptide repeat protein [Bacteroidota bacterium]
MQRSLIIIVWCCLFSVLTAQQDQSQNMFRLAQSFEQQGDHERALPIYAELFRSDSSNFVYFDAMRRTLVQLKRYDDAIRISTRRAALAPFDAGLKAGIGSLYAMAGNERAADSLWNDALATGWKNQMTYRAVANEQMSQRLFDKAIATYKKGRSEIGDQFLFANELGYLYSFILDYTNTAREYLRMLRQNEQQYDFVQSRLAAVVARRDGLAAVTAAVGEELAVKQSIPLLRLSVWVAMEGDRFADAFRAAQTIESLVNSNGQELFTFAERVFRENEFTIASDAYRLSLAKSDRPSFGPAARYGIARCMEELSVRALTAPSGGSGDSVPTFTDAVAHYSALAAEFPFSVVGANALFRIGWIRAKYLHDLDGARRDYDSVLTTAPAGPMVPTVLSAIGEILTAQNRLDEAAAVYRRMNASQYSTAEQRSMAVFRMAEIQFLRNDLDSTLGLLKPLTENLKADESNDALLLQYFVSENRLQFTPALRQFAAAELLARRSDLGAAVQEFRAIADLYPAAPLADDALLKVAEYSIQLKRYADAMAAYTTVMEEYKESTERDKTQFRIAELYHYHLQDKQKAISAYEMVLSGYPMSLFADEARKRIRQLRGDSI